jgi:hypothetical protein
VSHTALAPDYYLSKESSSVKVWGSASVELGIVSVCDENALCIVVSELPF